MTAKTIAKFQANWRFIVLIAAIFLAGWGAKEAVSRDTAAQVAVVKQDLRAELSAMRQDVRDIYKLLASGIRVIPSTPIELPLEESR